MKKETDKQNMEDWASGKGNNVPAWHSDDKAYVQTPSTTQSAVIKTPERQTVNSLP